MTHSKAAKSIASSNGTESNLTDTGSSEVLHDSFKFVPETEVKETETEVEETETKAPIEMTEAEIDALIEEAEAATRREEKLARLAAIVHGNVALKTERVLAEAKTKESAKEAEIFTKSEATKAHAKMLRLEKEATLKDEAVKKASDEMLPLLEQSVKEQAALELAKDKRALESVTESVRKSSQVESAQELRAKKLLATHLAEADKGKAEIKMIIERGVQAVNRLQLRSASQSETTEATAMGDTHKHEVTVDATTVTS